MHRHHSIATRDPVRRLLDDEPYQVRFVYENPSDEHGWSLCFGVRESFARSHCRFVNVEPYAAQRAPADCLTVTLGNFFDRVTAFRQNQDGGIYVYWVILLINVSRGDREDTMMPAVACSVFTPHKTLAARFDTILRNPDADEDKRLAYCLSSTARILPIAVGDKRELEFASTLLEGVHEGLRIGYELAHPELIDKRLRKKPN